jgi:hypothetical protein
MKSPLSHACFDLSHRGELNGLPEEHILIAGAVRLSTRATSKLWRDQVIEFIAIGDRSID